MVLATLGDFVDEPAPKEQIILATLPTSFGGLGFQQLMAYLHFLPYAASVVLALAVLREHGIDLDSERVTEATPIITLGGETMSGAPGVMILERPVRELKKLSARMSARHRPTHPTARGAAVPATRCVASHDPGALHATLRRVRAWKSTSQIYFFLLFYFFYLKSRF